MQALLAVCLGMLSAAGLHARPHIVAFFADDLGGDDTTVYGSNNVSTPNLERLAQLGMTFDRAFVASPSCAPSRAALLTGLMPARNGAEANHTYPVQGVPYLTATLKRLGYQIAAFGKVGHGGERPEYSFDYYSHPRVGLAANVAKYFEQRQSDKPLLMMVGDRRPHVPWTRERTQRPEGITLPPYFIDTLETRRHLARYFSDIAGMDEEFGKVMALADQRLGEDVVYVFTSDHGGQWPFGKWNLYDAGVRVPLVIGWKGHIQAGVRTDAMVSWVDLLPTLIDLAGGVVPDHIDGRSFAPVLLGSASEHRDLVFTTHSGAGVVNVYPIRSVRTRKFKYILNLLPESLHTNPSDILRKDGAGAYWDSWDQAAATDQRAAGIVQRYFERPPEELYDLSRDRHEQTNLAGDEDYKDVKETLRAVLEDWMDEQGDKRTVFSGPYPASGPRPDADTVSRQ